MPMPFGAKFHMTPSVQSERIRVESPFVTRPLTCALVIPTLNEADTIANLLAAPTTQGFDELIVVDGGSTDATCALVAARPGVRLIHSGTGRGTQLDSGLRAASAEFVVFLHADSVLPAGARDALSAALADREVIGGAFRLRFDDSRPWLRFYSWWTRFDSAVTTFGDQAIFCRRQALVDAGGLPHWPFLEDVELRRRLRAAGRFVKLPLAVTTSARRFHRQGVVCQQLLNTLIVIAFWLGVSPARLAGLYRPRRIG
jgi:rSAM/selenodomain-associated transferase 2